MLSTQSYQRTVPTNVQRKRNWSEAKHIIGRSLHNFLRARFEKLNSRGKFSILEVGCGEGNTVLQLEHKYPNATIVAIDLNPYNKLVIGNKTVFLERDIQEFVLENSFDCVVGVAILPYVRNKILALLNIWHSLKLHGVAVLSVQPYYFGPYALEMFAYGDIKWDHDHNALVVYKSSMQAQPNILPCLGYKYLEYCQRSVACGHFDSTGYPKLRYIKDWPSFLQYPKKLEHYSGQVTEDKPYEQAIVSLYVKNFSQIDDNTAEFLFTTKELYPNIMVVDPQASNRCVDHEAFVAIKAETLSSELPTDADRLRLNKDDYRRLLKKAEYNGPTPTCIDLIKSCIFFWRCPPYQKMNDVEFATEKYLESEGKRFV